MAELMEAHLNLNERSRPKAKSSTQPNPSKKKSTPATTSAASKPKASSSSAASSSKAAKATPSQEPSIVKQIKKSVSRLDTTSDIGLENLVNVLHHFAFGIEQQQQQQPGQPQLEAKRSKSGGKPSQTKAARENIESSNAMLVKQ